MKLTPDTDPATIMLKGHPNVVLTAITRGHDRNTVYVKSATENRCYNADGTYAYGPAGSKPNVVYRNAFDPAKPIEAVSSTGTVYAYEVEGVYIPVDLSQPTLVKVKRTERDGGLGNQHDVNLHTGKVNGGLTGSALTFRNVPEQRVGATIVEIEGAFIALNYTVVGDKITSVSKAD